MLRSCPRENFEKLSFDIIGYHSRRAEDMRGAGDRGPYAVQDEPMIPA